MGTFWRPLRADKLEGLGNGGYIRGPMTDSKLLFAEETFVLRGACFEVYRVRGVGFSETVYQESLEVELGIRLVPFESQSRFRLTYKGRELSSSFQPDLVCYDSIVVELKAMTGLTDEHRAQLHNYLAVTGHRVGLLVNFGHHPGVEIERIIR